MKIPQSSDELKKLDVKVMETEVMFSHTMVWGQWIYCLCFSRV